MAQATPGSEYTVQPGDTLYSIAQQAYGDSSKWPVIAQANAISDPNLIHPGQKLYIPVITPTPGYDYTVQQGDTLNSIAQQAYGDAHLWSVVANANQIPKPGQKLYIPSIMSCKVTASEGLNARAQPTSQSALITSFPTGTVLQFWEVVSGENVAGNPRWGRSPQEYYFWMGGTDKPNA
jgi:LysM repeat protein